MMKDRTRVLFADTMEQMLREMPMSKVRVTDLCARCGATTPTFYYYFHDKYELVAWMFLQDFTGVVGNRAPSYTAEVLISVAKRLESRKYFYRAAFSDKSQNSIDEYTREFNLQMAEDAVKRSTGQAVLTEEQKMAIQYHNYGVMGLFREWLFGETLTVEQMNTFLFEKTPDFLKEAYAQYEYVSEEILQRAGKKTKDK